MSQASKVIPLRPRKGAAPNTLHGKVPPPRRKNKDVRSREHLTPDEVERLIKFSQLIGKIRPQGRYIVTKVTIFD